MLCECIRPLWESEGTRDKREEQSIRRLNHWRSTLTIKSTPAKISHGKCSHLILGIDFNDESKKIHSPGAFKGNWLGQCVKYFRTEFDNSSSKNPNRLSSSPIRGWITTNNHELKGNYENTNAEELQLPTNQLAIIFLQLQCAYDCLRALTVAWRPDHSHFQSPRTKPSITICFDKQPLYQNANPIDCFF